MTWQNESIFLSDMPFSIGIIIMVHLIIILVFGIQVYFLAFERSELESKLPCKCVMLCHVLHVTHGVCIYYAAWCRLINSRPRV